MIRNFHVEFLSQVCGATLYHQLGEFMKRIRIFFIIFCSFIFIAALTSVLFTYKILSTEKEEIPEKENLIILCPICHRKLTSHKYKLINREQIVLY